MHFPQAPIPDSATVGKSKMSPFPQNIPPVIVSLAFVGQSDITLYLEKTSLT